jgi:hypothetical protein
MMKFFWNRLAWIAVIGFVIAVCSTARLHAQGYGNIVGTITDPSGAVIPSATVTATQIQNGNEFTAKTGANGAYVFPSLLPANYTISVVATGFEKYTQTGIVLLADQSVTVNIKLVVGSSSVTVSVNADAPQVDTTSGTLSQVVDEAHVVDLPLNGRNPAALITLVAGVSDASNEGNGTNQGNGKTFPELQVASANGTTPAQSNYLLNGGNNVDEMTNVGAPYPFPDALQEFSVQTSNYNAEYGQSAGAVVNIITKSGGEKFHGDAFEFLRNGYFDARPPFAASTDILHRHQFGGTLGGPVIIPGFSKGKSTQFFVGYQYTLYHQGSNASTTTVPTSAEEGGNLGNLCTGTFSAAPTTANNNNNANVYCSTASQQIYNPFTGEEYENNVIPAGTQDPASKLFQAAFPTFTGTETAGKLGGTVPYFKPTTEYFQEYIARMDHSFGDKDHLFGDYYQNYFNDNPIYNPANLASYTSYFTTRYHSAILAETHTFTNNILNNFIANYQREVALRGGPPGSQDITAFGVGAGTSPAFWQPTGAGVYMTASVSSYFGEGSSAFAAWGRNNYTFNDDLHWVKGNHSFAVGGHYEISKFDVTNVYQSFGTFGFNKTGSSIPIANVDAYSNFLMGFMTSFQQGNFEQVNDRNHFPGIYAQDVWKILPRLTLNYGVRWETFAPWANRNGVEQEFLPADYAAKKSSPQYATAAIATTGVAYPTTVVGLPSGMMLSGDPGIPKYGIESKYMQFMPRVGFSYDVFGDGKTVVRGGGGIFYQDRMPGFFNLSQASWVPNTESVSASNFGLNEASAPGSNPGGPFSNPYCSQIGGVYTGYCSAAQAIANPFPFTLPFPSTQAFTNGITITEYDPTGKFRVPVTDDFNLTIEHQFAPSWAARVAYVGSVSRHQFVNLEVNPAVNTGTVVGGVLTYPTGTSSANSRRVYNTAPNVGPCQSATLGPVAGTGCAANYSDIIEASMSGSAGFNSLQASLDKKMSHGLSLLFNYVYSSAFDSMPQMTRVNNQEDLNAGASYVYPVYPAVASNMPAGAYAFPNYKALDRGRSDIDKPHVISFSYVWEFPKLHEGNPILKEVVNGWRTSGLIQHHSGDSLTIYTATDNSGTGLSQDRANRDFTQSAYLQEGLNNGGNCPAWNPTPGKQNYCRTWFNTAAFSVPANTGAGTGFGNVIKGSLRGPGYTNWDGAVIRTFAVYRDVKIDFRAEYFDLLNHTELSNPNVTVTSSTFGNITGAGGPRIGEFALKVLF